MARKKTNNRKRKILLVTGLSGAGMSTALKSLEDAGYKAVDNLPLALIGALLSQKEGMSQPVAIGIDTRAWDFTPEKLLRERKKSGAELVFIDCRDDVLQQRFTETRRVHPLAADRPVGDGVTFERKLMKPLKSAADHVIDTTDLKAQDLRRIMEGRFGQGEDGGLRVFVMSFGFKHGVPREADIVFDMRFLDNPHWDPKLRPLSGLDAPIARKIGRDPDFQRFFKGFAGLLSRLLPRYDAEGKNYLTIALGCTGGRHRSVFAADALYKKLRKDGASVAVRHRDIDKSGGKSAHGNKKKAVKRRKYK